MADTIRAADGGYLLNSEQFEYNKDNLGRPVLNLKNSGGGGEGDFKADGSAPMTGNLQMNSNSIVGVKSIDGVDVQYNTGKQSTIAVEAIADMKGHSIINARYPLDEQDVTTKSYVDTKTAEIAANCITSAGGKVAGLYITGSYDLVRGCVATPPSGSDLAIFGSSTGIDFGGSAGNDIRIRKTTTVTDSSPIGFHYNFIEGDLTLSGVATPIMDNQAANKAYVDAILPAFTEADNGKVLGIVNGALAWVNKT